MCKPVSYSCNLDCTYCFYLDKEQHVLPEKKQMKMDDQTLELYIQNFISAQEQDEILFAWQGGEPTLAGLDFYKKAVELQSKYANGKKIKNTFQTNAILIDSNWAEFFKLHNFLVGVSIDGPDFVHDHYRVTRSNKGTHNKVLQAINLLKDQKVEFNIITVITKHSLKYAQEIYHYITKNIGAQHIQFIPIVEHRSTLNEQLIYPSPDSDSLLTDWSISGEQYGLFMQDIFRLWVTKDVGRVFVQLFENALTAWYGYTPSLCTMRPTCGDALVLEQNGDIYSCDHYVYPEYKIGNIKQQNLNKIINQKKQKQFSSDKSKLNRLCHECEFKFTCHGGCPKHRTLDIGLTHKHNHLCDGYKIIFAEMDPYLKCMVKLIQSGKPASQIMNHIYQVSFPENSI
ncbi:anaerobic sulfatase maturase [Psychromonas ossibalaenae]|uniref:anaerobic sulfatase maturase n=1 Tax=Psychromonas ossibalaenae TaxID=444922 RepID=UPI001FDFAB45|nr:anaerobic sulfatase maturase [Psychromonas ossibalaenae]